MKNFLPIVKLACLTAAAALIVSCGDGADYRNVLPADSFVTMSVDAASLLKKSGTCDAASNPLLDRLKAELDKAEELSAEEKEYLFSGCIEKRWLVKISQAMTGKVVLEFCTGSRKAVCSVQRVLPLSRTQIPGFA